MEQDLTPEEFHELFYSPPPFVVEILGLRDDGSALDCAKNELTTLNDSGNSFKRIAEILRTNPEKYFVEPR